MRGTTIGRCIEHIEHDWQVIQYQNHRKLMLRNVLVGRRLTMLFVIFLYIGGMSYHTILSLSFNMKTNDNLTNRQLVYLGYLLRFLGKSRLRDRLSLLICCDLVQHHDSNMQFGSSFCGARVRTSADINDAVGRSGRRKRKKNKNTIVDKCLTLITRHHMRVLR